jgi:large subunit ribosomal protein L22
MEITAKARFLRFAPRKVRLVVDVVRGLGVSEALSRLSLMKQLAAKPVLKLIKSAQANASHNFKTAPDNLFIKSIAVDGGPVFKRWTAKAFGRANQIRHRTSHVSVVLSEKPEVAIINKKLKKSKVTEKSS